VGEIFGGFGGLQSIHPSFILTNGIISFYISCSGAVAKVLSMNPSVFSYQSLVLYWYHWDICRYVGSCGWGYLSYQDTFV